MSSLFPADFEHIENLMEDEVNVLDLTVRELIEHVDQTRDYVINDPDGGPYLVVLPLAHFLRLRERANDRGWWEMKEVICR